MRFPEDQNYINSTTLHMIDSLWEKNGNFFFMGQSWFIERDKKLQTTVCKKF